MNGRMGIVSGRYRSLSSPPHGENSPETVVELFGRTEEGRSVCLLVHGLRPTFEIAPIGAWEVGKDLPAFIEDRLVHVRAMEHVQNITGPVVKWTQLGDVRFGPLKSSNLSMSPPFARCSKPVLGKFFPETFPLSIASFSTEV